MVAESMSSTLFGQFRWAHREEIRYALPTQTEITVYGKRQIMAYVNNTRHWIRVVSNIVYIFISYDANIYVYVKIYIDHNSVLIHVTI